MFGLQLDWKGLGQRAAGKGVVGLLVALDSADGLLAGALIDGPGALLDAPGGLVRGN